MPRILLEDTFEFKPDRARITESKNSTTGLVSKRIPGRLSVCDCVNGNKRRYPKKVWEKNLAEGSPLKESMKRRASFGRLEHPKDGTLDLEGPISHLTIEANLVEVDGQWIVEGEILLLTTPEGNKLASLIDAGYDPLVSSRGFGSLESQPDGIDDVQEDFVCEGWDVVSKPSFTQAQLKPARLDSKTESTEATKKAASAPAPAKVEEAKPIHTPVKESISASPAKPTKTKTMDITEIKVALQALKAVNPNELSSSSFVEGMYRLNGLHNDAAKILSESPALSWEINQLHQGISDVEKSWNAAFEAPRTECKKLKENQTKLLQTLKGVAAHAVKFKTSIGESRKKNSSISETFKLAIQRGKRWMERAQALQDKNALLEKKYNFSTECLDEAAKRYKADVASIGRHAIALEFPNLTEDQKKVLAEAVTPKKVADFRKTVEKKDEKVDTTKKVEETKKEVKVEEKKTVVEDTTKKTESKIDESKVTKIEEKDVIFRSGADGPAVNESVSMARRLSQGASSYHS